MKPYKIRLSSGDLRAQGMYILLEDGEEKYTKLGITSPPNRIYKIEIAVEVIFNGRRCRGKRSFNIPKGTSIIKAVESLIVKKDEMIRTLKDRGSLKVEKIVIDKADSNSRILNDLFDIWIAKKKINKKPNTVRVYSVYYNAHIRNSIGKKNIDDINEDNIQLEVINKMINSGLNGNTIKGIKRILKPLFEENDKILNWKKIELPLPPKPRKYYRSKEDTVKIVKVLNVMSEYLSIAQMKKLQEVILQTFAENEAEKAEIANDKFLEMFLDAKTIEGCSERTIKYYRETVQHLLSQTETSVRKITTEEIREYLSDYQKLNNCSNVTIDNVRRNISSFFSWLEEEDYILKSPMRRIHKIKTKTVVKSVISDEGIEKLRDNCNEKRDLAIIDLLYSTGIRVGELVNLNIDDIDLEGRECIVYGKGDKERRVYFDAKAKVHLKDYINTRTDKNKALFVTLDAPHDRLKISGVEIRLRKLGRKLSLERIHPHKFRRSMATRAIDKGMPIEQVQKLLGHKSVKTTQIYTNVMDATIISDLEKNHSSVHRKKGK